METQPKIVTVFDLDLDTSATMQLIRETPTFVELKWEEKTYRLRRSTTHPGYVSFKHELRLLTTDETE